MSKTQEVAKTQNEQLPSYIKVGTGRGSENVTAEDIQLPRIDVLQALSPQVDKGSEAYIEGAEVGMIINLLTGKVFPEGLFFTPVSFVKKFLVWVDRKKDKAGGLRGVFDTEPEANAAAAADEDSSKLEVVPTAEHLLILDDGTEVIMSLAKSKYKVSRRFNSLVKLRPGDRFATRYSLQSIGDEGPKGKFKNLKIEVEGYPSEEIYLKAESLYETIAAGGKQASGNYDSGEAEEGEVKDMPKESDNVEAKY